MKLHEAILGLERNHKAVYKAAGRCGRIYTLKTLQQDFGGNSVYCVIQHGEDGELIHLEGLPLGLNWELETPLDALKAELLAAIDEVERKMAHEERNLDGQELDYTDEVIGEIRSIIKNHNGSC